MELLPAEKAHELTLSIDSEESIIKYINWAIESKRNYTYARPSNETLNKLKMLGYELTPSAIHTQEYRINW